MLLSRRNAHVRDSRIVFVEEGHQYYLDGKGDGHVSTTAVVHSLFPGFEPDSAIMSMKNSRLKPWKDNQFYGKSDEFIKAAWEKNARDASEAGTAMHANIENFYNGLGHTTDGREWELFKEYRKDHEHLVPYRTEWCIFAEDAGITGSVDMLYTDLSQPGKLIMADWKRCKEIKMSNRYQKGTHPLTKDLDSCNFIHYSFQLGIYKHILQRYYGYDISDTFILVLHPSQERYLKIQTKDVDDRVAALFAERIAARAASAPEAAPEAAAEPPAAAPTSASPTPTPPPTPEAAAVKDAQDQTLRDLQGDAPLAKKLKT